MIELTDLSKYNRKVNYTRMKAAGIGGAWIRLCQGLDTSLDPLYAVHKQGCEALGLPNGPYFFADYRKDARLQAGRLVELLGEGRAAALDLEYLDGWGKPSGGAMHQWACSFA
ncbi:MAG: hypothetical protein M1281_17050, partial [Chloroflexi bacterium]|nr:hypothetical protein [Chloroflexota bacterium]